jgi:hypothetical protein
MGNKNVMYFVAKWDSVSLTWKGLNQFATTDMAEAVATANRLYKYHGLKVKYRVMRAEGGGQTQVYVTE